MSAYAADYSIITFDVTNHTVVPVHLAHGGGFLLKLMKNDSFRLNI